MNGAMRAVGVSKRFGRSQVLRGLDLELADGAVTVLLGRSGAGKSTLLRLALGALRADAGTLTVLGEDPWRRSDAVRRRLGYVPDVPASCTAATELLELVDADDESALVTTYHRRLERLYFGSERRELLFPR